MTAIKRYAVPVAAAFLALAGLTCGAQSARATESGPSGCASVPGGGDSGATPLQGTGKWAPYLSGCLVDHTIYLRNSSGPDTAQVFIVRDKLRPLQYTVSTPGLSSITSSEIRQADEVIVGQSNGTASSPLAGVFAPGQLVAITAADGSLSAADVGQLSVSRDAIATATDGAAQIMAMVVAAAPKTTAYESAGASVLQDATECAKGIRENFDEQGDAVPSLPKSNPNETYEQQWIARVKGWAGQVGDAIDVGKAADACQEVLKYLSTGEAEEKSLYDKLLDGGWDLLADYLRDVGE